MCLTFFLRCHPLCAVQIVVLASEDSGRREWQNAVLFVAPALKMKFLMKQVSVHCSTMGWWSQLKGNCKYKIYYIFNLLVVDIKTINKFCQKQTNKWTHKLYALTHRLIYCKFMEDCILIKKYFRKYNSNLKEFSIKFSQYLFYWKKSCTLDFICNV